MPVRPSLASLGAAAALAIAVSCGGAAEPEPGPWRAWLESPGGPLPFELLLSREGDGLGAVVANGAERIDVPEVEVGGGRLRLGFPHYDAAIVARVGEGGRRLHGEWTRRAGPDAISRLAFHAEAGEGTRFPVEEDDDADRGEAPTADSVSGRWRVAFSSSPDPAVAVFESRGGASVAGTFLTTTGDYRYLAGDARAGRLRLSAFDGAHAFLFHARVLPDGTLSGDFWSRDTWHETWTAVLDPEAALPDALALTAAVPGARLFDLEFRDLDGDRRTLGDAGVIGRPAVVELFGSWCPNCDDAAAWMASVDERYRERGLAVVGLAFELTGDFERDARQVGRFAARHGLEFPLLVAGLADKVAASEAFPVVDRVRAYPTMIFLGRDGGVRAVHTGFSGPATGEAHARQARRLDALVESLLVPESVGGPGAER